ncbi:hypothetical protein D3C73_1346810 [compost metagenome]
MVVDDPFEVDMSDGGESLVQAGARLQRFFHELECPDFIELAETGIDGNDIGLAVGYGDMG